MKKVLFSILLSCIIVFSCAADPVKGSYPIFLVLEGEESTDKTDLGFFEKEADGNHTKPLSRIDLTLQKNEKGEYIGLYSDGAATCDECKYALTWDIRTPYPVVLSVSVNAPFYSDNDWSVTFLDDTDTRVSVSYTGSRTQIVKDMSKELENSGKWGIKEINAIIWNEGDSKDSIVVGRINQNLILELKVV